ncbi:MAG: TatD family hydrolase [Lachnospiraceae bacterium]|nr:TatD family hydrolase [Lachnospiraceae bacterium]
MNRYIDTHAHYDMAAFDDDRDSLLRKLNDAGIEKIICPAVSYDGIRTMMDTLKHHPDVYFALGQHPKYLLGKDRKQLHVCKTPKYKDLQHYLTNAQNVLYDIKHRIEEVSSLLHSDRVCAVGEVGLDYSYDPGPDERALQSAVFRSYIETALKQKLPMILHIRDAHEDALNILASYNTRFTGVIHCFQGNKALADWYIGLGFLIGIGTSIYHHPALLETVRDIDLDDIVLETDSPYLAAAGITDERNTSLSLPLIAESIAKEKGIPTDLIAEATYDNSRKVFNI